MSYFVAYSDSAPNRFWVYREVSLTQNGEVSVGDTPPSGFGDVMLYAVGAYIKDIATIKYAGAADQRHKLGMRFTIKDPATAISVFLGVERLVAFANPTAASGGETGIGTRLLQLQKPVLWRAQYSLYAESSPYEGNVAPTADCSVFALVARLRER